MTTILLVEDEASLADPLAFLLRKEGFGTVLAADANTALAQVSARGTEIDAILLDTTLPDIPGTELCKQLRAQSKLPIVLVTARDSDIDAARAAELGASDVLAKPYLIGEVTQKIADAVRKSTAHTPEPVSADATWGQGSEILRAGNVAINPASRAVTVAGQPVALNREEFEILEALVKNAGRVLTSGELIDTVGGQEYVVDRQTLDINIKRLRAKVEAEPASPRHLITVKGLGYKFEA